MKCNHNMQWRHIFKPQPVVAKGLNERSGPPLEGGNPALLCSDRTKRGEKREELLYRIGAKTKAEAKAVSPGAGKRRRNGGTW